MSTSLTATSTKSATKPTFTQLMICMPTIILLFTACSSRVVRMPATEQAEEKLSLGQKYLSELNYEDAIITFTEAIELDPENVSAYMGRAEAYRGTEQYTEAKADYSTVIEKTAEQPYEQANAYLGRAEVNVITHDDQDALNDYETATEVVETVQITDITEQVLEALKIKIYNGCAQLYIVFGRYDAAITAYTKALDSLDKLPEDTDVIDVFAAKIVATAGRAACEYNLGNYENVIPDYDTLIELGEDKTAERDNLLAAIALAKSKADDLGAAADWLNNIDHADYAESSGLNSTIETLQNISTIAAENGTEGYKAIKSALTTDAAQQTLQNILAQGYQLRWYDETTGNMLAIYTSTTAWDDVNAEANGVATPELIESLKEAAATTLTPMYAYWGSHENRSREGDGTWYILNPIDTDLIAKAYTWESDKPKGGYEKKVVETPVQWVTYHDTELYWDVPEPVTRDSAITYAIGGSTVRIFEQWVVYLDGTVNTSFDVTFILSQPVQSIEKGTRHAIFYVPAGTTIKQHGECIYLGESSSMNQVETIEYGKAGDFTTANSVTINKGQTLLFAYGAETSYMILFAAK